MKRLYHCPACSRDYGRFVQDADFVPGVALCQPCATKAAPKSLHDRATHAAAALVRQRPYGMNDPLDAAIVEAADVIRRLVEIIQK